VKTSFQFSRLVGFAAVLVFTGYSNCCSAWTGASSPKGYQGWPRVVKDVSPSGVTYKDYFISVSEAADQTGAGTGGGIFDVKVKNRKSGKTLEFEEQMIGERILETYNGHPQIEAWGRGGGGTYSRVLYRVENGEYKAIRDDLFDMNIERASRKDVTATLPGGSATLYYTDTMYPEHQ
jgi:hypothetical protein